MALCRRDLNALPACPGTYALVLFCRRGRRLRIGRLSLQELASGWYLYVGSAFGAGGLRARCRHHARRALRPRWHIDYLRKAATLQEIWFTTDTACREHQWAAAAGCLAGRGTPLARFGASDCACPSHLTHFALPPSLAAFRRLLRHRPETHGPIRALKGRVDAGRLAKRQEMHYDQA